MGGTPHGVPLRFHRGVRLQLQMSIVHSRADVAAVVDALPVLVGRLRDLSIDSAGVLDPTTGERREGLAVTSGVHCVPGSRYRLVTQAAHGDDADVAPIISAIELLANDRRQFGLAIQGERPSFPDVVVTAHDLNRLGVVDVQSVHQTSERWLFCGPTTIDGTADLAQIRSADGISSAAAMRLHHRRIVATGTLTAAPGDGTSIRLTIDATVRGRGLMRPLLAVASLVFAGKIRRSVAHDADEAMARWRKARTIGGRFDATTIADSLLAEWLPIVVPAVVVPAVVTPAVVEADSSGPLPR